MWLTQKVQGEIRTAQAHSLQNWKALSQKAKHLW